jgi:hypothetical protein
MNAPALRTGAGGAAQTGAAPYPAAGDWDLLFTAILGCMRRPLKVPCQPAPELHATLIGCALALEQLQSALTQERGRGLRIERELRQAQQSLAELRGRLDALRGGQLRGAAPRGEDRVSRPSTAISAAPAAAAMSTAFIGSPRM